MVRIASTNHALYEGVGWDMERMRKPVVDNRDRDISGVKL